jgi:hypothetical protein
MPDGASAADSADMADRTPSERRHLMIPALVVLALVLITALFFLRHVPPELYYPAVPAAPDGVDPLSYSADMSSWCGEQSIERLADRFGVAPTAEAAAWAVANSARPSRDLRWNAAYEGCLRGLRSRQ